MRSPESRPGHKPGRTFEEELNLRYLSPGAFTILSPEDHGAAPDPPRAPQPYRISPSTKRHRNQAFSIIAEPLQPYSRSPSPSSGRISPFRGRGFNPVGSRHATPAHSPERKTSQAMKSQIPQLKRRGSAIIFSEESDGSPKAARRKSTSAAKHQLSKSLNYIGPTTVDHKPPLIPNKRPNGLQSKAQLISRLSPIIGSSPEPSSDTKSLSSPTRIPISRSTPPSRKNSPSREFTPDKSKPSTRANSRATSRSSSRISSRNVSRDSSPSSKPPFSPTRIPVRNSRTVKGKINSYNAKTSLKNAKVPSKTDEIRSRASSRTNLSRKDSLSNKSVSSSTTRRTSITSNQTKPSVVAKPSITTNKFVKKGTISSIGSSTGDSKVLDRSGSKILDRSVSKVKSSVASRQESMKKKEDPRTSMKRTTTKTSSKKSASPVSTPTTAADASSTPASADNDTISELKPKPADDAVSIESTGTQKSSADSLLKKVEIVTKLPEQIPNTATVVSSTTATVTQPLRLARGTPKKTELKPVSSPAEDKGKPKEKAKPKETPMYMDEGRVLSATSVSNAIERMNDTVLDSHTLLKDHNLSKLSPSASAIISLSNDKNTSSSKSASAAVPSVETVTNKINTISQNVNNKSVSSLSKNNANAKGMQHNVNNNIKKLISPDDSFGAKVNNHEKSANERIKEARTMVASDVKPIRIMVQEKPNYVEVQSGNVRFPQSATNGNMGAPPPQAENGNQPPEPPKSRCQLFLDKFRSKMPCACCKPTSDSEAPKQGEKPGCFGCLKKKNKEELEEIIVTNPEDNKPVSCLDRLKCCRNNKVGDSTGCCGRRKDKKAGGKPLSMKTRCKNFFKTLFCCGCKCCKRKPKPVKIDDSASRRASMLSKKKSLTPTVLPQEDPKNKLDSSLVEYSSTMKAAVPILPVYLAYFCLFFNVVAPGTGTVFSGMFCLCMGKPRFSQRDSPKARLGSFIVNIVIGVGQAFTILFCLVGWGWSIWWGVIMIKVAKKYKKLKKIEERMEAQEKKAAAEASPLPKKDVEKGRS